MGREKEYKNRRYTRNIGVDRIFEMLKEGRPVSEITSRMEEKERSEKESRARGMDSELKTKTALETINFVYRVRNLSEISDGYDSQKIDLGVYLDSDVFASEMNILLSVPKNEVFVQVKSSDPGIKKFKHDLKQKFKPEIGSGTVEDWLHRRRIILIDGQSGSENICKNFKKDLLVLNQYFLAKLR